MQFLDAKGRWSYETLRWSLQKNINCLEQLKKLFYFVFSPIVTFSIILLVITFCVRHLISWGMTNKMKLIQNASSFMNRSKVPRNFSLEWQNICTQIKNLWKRFLIPSFGSFNGQNEAFKSTKMSVNSSKPKLEFLY